MQPNRHQAGFTLLEVIVSLAVLGLVVVMISAGVRFGLASWRVQTEGAARIAELDSIDRLFRTLITEIDITRKPPLVGSADSVSFGTLLPRVVASDQRHVAATLKVTANHRLVLLWRPIGQPGNAALTETTLLENVNGVEFWYLPSLTASSAAWRQTWEDGLPELVRVRIKFAAGDSRHWPDMLLTPIIKLGGNIGSGKAAN